MDIRKLIQSGGLRQTTPTGLRDVGGNPVSPSVIPSWVNQGSPGGVVAGASTMNNTAPAVVDPNAAERNSFMSMLPGAVGNIVQSGREAFGSAGRNLRGAAESLFNTVNQGQRAINTSRENVELNRLNAVKDIVGFVRNGLRSGGARLANMNATESSAAGELGRVYGQLGGERMRNVGNKAFLDNRNIDTQQEALDLQRGQGRTDFARSRDEAVSSIGAQVREKLAKLDAEGQGLGITGKIAVDQEKQRVIDEGMRELGEIDAWLGGQLASVTPQNQAATRTNAIALQQGGTGNVTPFDFGEFTGQQLMGPAIDQLPIFTRNRRVERA